MNSIRSAFLADGLAGTTVILPERQTVIRDYVRDMSTPRSSTATAAR